MSVKKQRLGNALEVRASFITPYAILEIGADPGDLIILEPATPRVPVLKVSNPDGPIIGFDRRYLPLILDHIENFSLVSLAPQDPHMTPDQMRRWIAAIALKSPSPSTEPIEADSDAGALFELLCRVGGKMPPGEEVAS